MDDGIPWFEHLRASADTTHLAASTKAGWTTIWKTDASRPISSIKTGFHGGENRHAIDSANSRLYSGLWEGGLSCFNYATGRRSWRRRDLLGIQQVDVSSANPGSLFVSLETPDHLQNRKGSFTGVIEIDARDGSTIWKTTEAWYAYPHSSRDLLVVEDRVQKEIRTLDESRQTVGRSEMLNFAVLDVAFNDDLMAVAEGAQGVRVLDMHGNTISRYLETRREPNCIRVFFVNDQLCAFDSWGTPWLIFLEPRTGEIKYEIQCDATHICFIDDGLRFITQLGRIFDSVTGKQVGHISPDHLPWWRMF